MSIKLQLSVLALALVQSVVLVLGTWLAPAMPVSAVVLTLAPWVVGVSAVILRARSTDRGFVLARVSSVRRS